MTIIQAAILGIVQGLTEFLPISSSGHLCLAQHLLDLGGGSSMVAFDVALHVASLLAIVVVFARRIRAIVRGERRLIGYIVLATIPVGIIGVFLGGAIEGLFDRPHAVASALIVTGAALVLADYLSWEKSELNKPSPTSSIVMGTAQALAMIPGISRSGFTITAGLACGLDREDAFEFSFLMAIPAILGAAAYKLLKSQDGLSVGLGAISTGMVLSFAFSVAGLLLLRKLLLSRKLKWLGAYCGALGVCALGLL